MKEKLKRHFNTIGLIGVFCSWATLAFVWMGLITASYVGFSVTAGLFGAAMVVGNN
jgi:hypothetical protein